MGVKGTMGTSITTSIGIDAGHRLLDHEGQCRNVHGHRYTFEITCEAKELDAVGRVVDFSVVKSVVGGWLNQYWDHGFIVQAGDPLIDLFMGPVPTKFFLFWTAPTAERLAEYLFHKATHLLKPYQVRVVKVRCHETPNNYADYECEEGKQFPSLAPPILRIPQTTTIQDFEVYQ